MRRIALVTLTLGLVSFGGASAQDLSQYPIMDKVVKKILNKYQTSTCEQLAAEKANPGALQEAMAARAVKILRENPDMRKVFIDAVAAPIANKMFECGMIP